MRTFKVLTAVGVGRCKSSFERAAYLEFWAIISNFLHLLGGQLHAQLLEMFDFTANIFMLPFLAFVLARISLPFLALAPISLPFLALALALTSLPFLAHFGKFYRRLVDNIAQALHERASSAQQLQ
jgi:hypothetical protein